VIANDMSFHTKGVPPATLAEFTLSSNPSIPDNYDVSLVDGYNLPMRVETDKGCPVGSCTVDLGPNCASKSSQN
jgi:hypothetical protein